MLHKTRILFPILPFILSLIWESLRLLKVAVNRTLAPLRRVLTRELKVFAYDRFGTHRPLSFVVIDALDCGHFFTSHEWSFRDLLYAYADPVESPHVTARRHRCHECRDLAAAKKPVQSVQLQTAKAGAA